MDIIASDKDQPSGQVKKLMLVWPMYRAFVGVGAVCGFLIVMAFILTMPLIKNNQAIYLERSVLQVLPGASYKKAFVVNSQEGASTSVLPATADQKDNLVFAGYNQQHELVGVAVEARGMGYQDTIQVLYGYDPERQVIVGMKVLASKETPGLGDKIEKDPGFIANFRGLDVSLNRDGLTLKNNIQLVKNGLKTQAWQVDGITGATISSRAIAAMIDESARRQIPVLHRHIGTFITGASNSNER